MATTYDAILKIAAQVTGVDRIASLTDQMKRAEDGARGLGRSSGFLAGTMDGLAGKVAALASAGSLIAFTGSIIKAGDEAARLKVRIETLAAPFGEVNRLYGIAATAAERYGLSNQDAAASVADLYGRLRPMGMSIKEVETTFNGLMNATRRAGLSMVDARAAALQLGQAMGSGRLQGDEFGSLMERLPGLAQALVTAYNNIARSKGLELVTKDQAKRMTEELKEGERQQIQNLKETIREKERLLRDETNDILREIQRRYAAIEQRIDDHYDDVASEQERRENELSDQRQEAINDAADQEIKLIQRRYEDERRVRLSNQQNLSEEQKIILERRFQDQEELEIESVRDRASAAIKAEQQTMQDAQRERSRLLRDEREKRMQQLQDAQQKEEEMVRNDSERRLEQLKASQEQQIAAIKAANVKAQAQIVARTAATIQNIKELSSQGLLSAQVAVEAMKIFAEKPVAPPTGLQLLTKAFQDMRTELGNKFFPIIQEKMPLLLEFIQKFKIVLIELKPTILAIGFVLEKTIQVFNGLVTAFTALPKPIQKIIGFFVNLKIVSGLLAAALNLVFGLSLPGVLTGFAVQLVILLAKIELGFTALSTWIGAQFIPKLTLAFSGFLSWMTATFVPAMIAFFSGPAGWITLAVVAIGGLLYIFRDPIAKAIKNLVEQTRQLFAFLSADAKSLWEAFQTNLVIPIQEGLSSAWNNVKKGWSDLMKGMEDRAKTFASVFSDISKKVINFFVQGWVRSINLIVAGLNRIAAVTNSKISIPSLNIPELAEGGYARSEAIVKIAERGEPEYVIPESKMHRAAVNALQGRTGIDVLNAQPRSLATASSIGPVTVEVRPMSVTYVKFNGENFVREAEIPEIINMAVERVHALMAQSEVQASLRY